MSGRTSRKTLRLLLPLLLGAVPWVLLSCAGGAPEVGGFQLGGAPLVNADDLPDDVEWMTDEAGDAGLDFFHFNGTTGAFYYPEIMGSGVAMLDYDNDGDLDIYMVQQSVLDGSPLSETIWPPTGPVGDRLYRNDLIVDQAGNRTLRFTDVTEEAGIDSPGFGSGVATGDYDNDGWVDMYITNFQSNQLYHNNGDGTFTNVTEMSGTDDERWGCSSAFVDYDADGWLDLYVSNYVDFRLTNHKECIAVTGAQDYCAPGTYGGVPDSLFRNRGDGTFEDVSLAARVSLLPGAGLGVVTGDLSGDGLVDIYVANDQMVNFYWVNQGNGTFKNEALMAGVAVNATGSPESSMGIDAADFDSDGDLDLFMTHLRGETNTLYVNNGNGMFMDQTVEAGLGVGSRPSTGFGTTWFDLNNDGWLDLFMANGAVTAQEIADPDDLFSPYREPNQLFLNLGNGIFEEVTGRGGEVFKLSEVSRGAAFGDIDNDGDVDVAFSNNAGPARLLINNIGNRASWVGLRLVQNDAPRDAPGARVAVTVAGRLPLWREVRTVASYCSSNDPRVLVGLGDATTVETIRVEWPRGEAEEWTDVPVNQWTTLQQGTGVNVR